MGVAKFTNQLASAQSLASDFNSDAIRIDIIDMATIFIKCTSVTDNTGSFALQWRAQRPESSEYSSWGDLVAASSDSTLADADKDIFFVLRDLAPGEIRLKFVAAGGTPDGSAEIWISARNVGR